MLSEIDLKCIVNEFIDESEHRSSIFSKFTGFIAVSTCEFSD